MTISGVYRIYSDGELISEQSNLITTAGKRVALDVLAGKSRGLTQLVIGAGATAAVVGDTTLEAPFYVSDILFSTPLFDGASSKIVYKARLPETLACSIYELGSVNTAGPNPLIFSFDSSHVYSGTYSTTTNNNRFGADSINIAPAAVVTCTQTVPLPGTSPTDSIVLAGAFNTPSGTNSISLILTDSSGLTATRSYSFANSSSYQIVSNTISSFTAAGGFNWDSISSITVDPTTANFATMDVDFVSMKSDVVSGKLFSRSIYGTPVVKKLGAKMDIEYEIGWNLS